MLAEAAGAGPARDDGHAPDFVDDVVLLVSELCENAVLHAGTAFDLAVWPTTTRSPWPSPTAARARWSCTSPNPASATGGPPPTVAACP